jgi:predicted AAA+ superfamily ATPase
MPDARSPVRSYRPRLVDAELDALLPGVPALVLEGAKGVGKTASAARRARTVVRLDDPAQREVAQAEPSLALRGTPPVLLDEWQQVPAVWDAVRRAVDDGAPPGQFLLTGSASPLAPPSHSGAGRIVSVRMRPLSLAERQLAPPTVSLGTLLAGGRPPIDGHTTVTLADYAREIVASGFPGLRGVTGRALRAQLDGYLARVVDRDFLEQGHAVRKPQALRRWMTAYAAATATTTSLEKIRQAAGAEGYGAAARDTAAAYREVLERLWLLDPLPGWLPTRNRFTRLAQGMRHHLADPALAARLLEVEEGALLAGAPSPRVGGGIATAPRDGALLGQLFESLVTLSVRCYAQWAEARVHHLRTHDGRREVDLVVTRGDQRVVALEVKLSATVEERDVRHLHWLREQLGDDLLDAAVLTTGTQAYRRADGIAVVPAVLLGA